MIKDLWYKNAVIYCLDVETFMDASGDGIGDFEGLSRRLEYLAGLGVTCLWLQPFYPSPNRDNGYDITDYFGVHQKHGTPGDFVELMNHAGALGLRVIVDLVVNHTSIDHPWFQSARKDEESPFRDWYVTVNEQIEQGDQVLTHFDAYATHVGRIGVVRPTGKMVMLTGMLWSRFSGQRAHETMLEVSALEMLERLDVFRAPRLVSVTEEEVS